MKKKIKNSDILVIGSGSTLKDYLEEIKEFVRENNVVTIGCNNMSHMISPNYHFWTDKRRYFKFGKNINKKSIPVFSNYFKKYEIRKYWKGSYEIINYKPKKWSKYNDDPNSLKYCSSNPKYNKVDDCFSGVFRATGSLIILWAYIRGAKNISVVGMDGYTLHSINDLNKGNVSQHCYSNGYTDKRGIAFKFKKLNSKRFYQYSLDKDEDIYKTLRLIKKLGANFEILTPTVYKDFYNPNIIKRVS